MRLTPVLLIRMIGVLLCSSSVLLTLLHPASVTDSQISSLLSAIMPLTSPAVERALSLISPALIASMLWVCTEEHLRAAVSRQMILLLAVQTALALLIAPELQFIVAVEAGLLLPPRFGALWVTTQAASSWLSAVLYPQLMSWLLPSDADPIHRTLGIGLFMLIAMLYNLFAFGLGWLAAAERSQSQALETANRRLSTAQTAVSQAARLQERLSIARELHDAVGHQLTALSINLQVASHLSQDAAKASIDQAYALTGDLLSDVRRVVSSIREPSPVNLVESISSFAIRVVSPRVHLDLVEIPLPNDHGLSLTMVRCAQEIITNAVRHADASNLYIAGLIEDDHYRLSAHDDGKGSYPVVPGNGLKGIEERVLAHCGRVTFDSSHDRGFTVDISIPMREASI